MKDPKDFDLMQPSLQWKDPQSKDPQSKDLQWKDLPFELGDGAARACAAWEALLPDAAEDLLVEEEQKALDAHVRTCPACAWELADAQRGAAWLALLKDHVPQPPATLLSSILITTSGADLRAHPVAPTFPAEIPASFPVLTPIVASIPSSISSFKGANSGIWQRFERWLGFGDSGLSSALHPRLAMTSAMAFFSICLTLNVLGVSVRNLHVDSLRPAGLQRTVADRSAFLVRSFEGNRVVYRVESRVNEWRTASTAQGDPPLAGRR